MPRTTEQLEKIKGKTRSKILDSALELFATRGFHGTSMQDIADKADVSKGLAYNYFESKEKILFAILDTALVAGSEILSNAENVDDPYEQLKLLIEKTFEHIEANENYWRMFTMLMLQPQLSDFSDKMVNEFGTNAVEQTKKICRKLGIKNPIAEALILDGAIDGIILHYLFFKDKYPLKSVKKQLLKRYSKEYLNKLKD